MLYLLQLVSTLLGPFSRKRAGNEQRERERESKEKEEREIVQREKREIEQREERENLCLLIYISKKQN